MNAKEARDLANRQMAEIRKTDEDRKATAKVLEANLLEKELAKIEDYLATARKVIAGAAAGELACNFNIDLPTGMDIVLCKIALALEGDGYGIKWTFHPPRYNREWLDDKAYYNMRICW